VRAANAFRSDVRIHGEGAVADCKSILGLLGLAAGCGTVLLLEAEGCDAEDAVSALAGLLSDQPDGPGDQHGEDGLLAPDEGCATGRPLA
jgi:phosphotransferase system HPr (HPr) family protein